MNFLQYLVHGPKYTSVAPLRRDSYDIDPKPFTIKNSVNPFAGKVTTLKDDGQTKTAIIDKVVQVKTVSDRIFQAAKKGWSGLAAKSTLTAVVTVIGGVAAVASAIALGILVPPLFPIAIAVGILGLTVLGTGILSSVRAQQAKQQKNAWTDPVQMAQQERMRIGTMGFKYVQKKGWKGTYLSQAETKQLWRQNLAACKQAFRQNESSHYEAQAKIIKDFFEHCPIGYSAVEYAFKKVPNRYSLYNTGYYDLNNRYHQITMAALKSKSAAYTQQSQQIDQIQATSSMNHLMLDSMSAPMYYHYPHHHHRHHHQYNVAGATTGALQVANSVAAISAIAASSAETDQRIHDINQREAQQLSSLFTETKALLDNYPN